MYSTELRSRLIIGKFGRKIIDLWSQSYGGGIDTKTNLRSPSYGGGGGGGGDRHKDKFTVPKLWGE